MRDKHNNQALFCVIYHTHPTPPHTPHPQFEVYDKQNRLTLLVL